jgi:hypothetical protein
MVTDDELEQERQAVMTYVAVEEGDPLVVPSQADFIRQHVIGRVVHNQWRVSTMAGDQYWVFTNPTGSYEAAILSQNRALQVHIGINVILCTRGGGLSPY